MLDLVASIVSAHVAHNAVTPEVLPGVIHPDRRSNHPDCRLAAPAVAKPEPAVPAKRSVFPDYVICLEDGKKQQMLIRRLSASYGMTPAEYRARWSLPHDDPMVAPKYAARRSALAKEIGLGRLLAGAASRSRPRAVPYDDVPRPVFESRLLAIEATLSSRPEEMRHGEYHQTN